MSSFLSMIDPLSWLFICVIVVVTLAITIYSVGYIKPYLKTKTRAEILLHYFSLAVMFFSMLAVVTIKDGFWFLFSWELMTISSFVLILFDAQKQAVRRAALNYLVLMHIGFVFLLIGFVTLTRAGLSADFDSLAPYFAGGGAVVPLFLLFLVGFGMKAAMFPLHVWLPEAHPAAPAHISALMSGVMIKMGLYGILRVVMAIESDLYTVGVILFVAGVITGLWGVLLASLQNEMKKILAYSSIENMGIIFIALGIGLVGKAESNSVLTICGIGGALLHMVNHSMFKSLLFMGAGGVYTATHTTSLDALGGLGRRMPVSSILFFMGVIAICALPPLNGFVSEFVIYLGLFDAVATEGSMLLLSIVGIIVLALIGGTVALAFTKLYGVVFLGAPRSAQATAAHELPAAMITGMAIPLAGIVCIGMMPTVFIQSVFDITAESFAITNRTFYTNLINSDLWQLNIAVWVLVVVVALVWIVKTMAIRARVKAESPTWGCAFTAPTPKMQYSGESFSEGLANISGMVTNNTGVKVTLPQDEIFPTPHSFEMKHKDKMDSLFAMWWVKFIKTADMRLGVLRSGMVNHYVLYALLFLLLIFLLSVLNII